MGQSASQTRLRSALHQRSTRPIRLVSWPIVWYSAIQTKLKKSPTANLSPFLQQQAASYGQLVANLAATQNIENHSDDSDCPDPSSELSGLLLDVSPDIIHPLDDRVVRVSLRGATSGNLNSSAILSTDIVSGLNEAIQGGEILWRMHNTFVIGLGSSEVVKISTSFDLDEIDNLNYLNSLSLGLPIPLCLGTLRSGRRTYFFMSRAPGQPLERLWPQLKTIHKASIQKQLTNMFSTLRSMPPHGAREEMRIGSFVLGTCKDMRRSQRVSVKPIHMRLNFKDFLYHHHGRTHTS